jgi:hypothetical protein
MKFKQLVSKLQEKKVMEEGKPETTAAYAKATPGQPPIVFDTDIQYDGHKVAAELDPAGDIKHQMGHALSRQDKDNDGDVDAQDKNTPDEVTGSKKDTLALIKKGAAERAHTKKGVAYESIDLKKAKMGDVIKDFQKSDAPQFAGKSDEKKREMAIAAKLSADDEKKEEVEVDERNKENAMKRKNMDASRGAKFKLNNTVPDRDSNHKTGVAHNKSIGRALRNEEKDEREYGYEGDMAISQLKTIVRHADHMMGMLKPETDLPEWVQSKITLATDYMQTAHDYMMSEMTESYDGRVLGRITSAEVHKVLGPTKNAAQGIAALKKAFKVDDAQAKAMMDKVMKESVEQIDESEDKTIGRLKQLVRFGLMDKSKLAILSRSMKSLEKGQVTNPTERNTLFELLNELIGLVTGDDAMFAKVRMNVQKEEFDKED